MTSSSLPSFLMHLSSWEQTVLSAFLARVLRCLTRRSCRNFSFFVLFMQGYSSCFGSARVKVRIKNYHLWDMNYDAPSWSMTMIIYKTWSNDASSRWRTSRLIMHGASASMTHVKTHYMFVKREVTFGLRQTCFLSEHADRSVCCNPILSFS